MKQYVITVVLDLKSVSVYGPFGAAEEAYEFLNEKIDAGELYFSDTDFVEVQEIMSSETILEDYPPEEDFVDEHNEGDNEETYMDVEATQIPELSDDEKKYHTALYYYSVYLSAYNPQKILAVAMEGKDPDEYIDELFWNDPENAIQEMIDSDFPMVKTREEIVTE